MLTALVAGGVLATKGSRRPLARAVTIARLTIGAIISEITAGTIKLF